VYNSIHRHSSIQIPSDNLLIYKRNTEEPMPVGITQVQQQEKISGRHSSQVKYIKR